jgi:hypothetical protein
MIPVKFRKSPEQVASYDYVDLVTRTGYRTFQGFATTDSTGTHYHLGNSTMIANIESITGYLTTGTLAGRIQITGSPVTGHTDYVQSLDIDFDLEAFKIPQIVEGVAHVNFCYKADDASNGTGIYSYFVAKLRKVSNSVESEIASTTSATLQGNADAHNYQRAVSLNITIPETSFKAGDILRLTIEGWWKDSEITTGVTLKIACDPQDRDGNDATFNLTPSTRTDITTKLILSVPFKLDV